MPVRLPMFDSSRLPFDGAAAPRPEARMPLPGTVGVADTGDGSEALVFARALADALREGGLALPVALTAFDRAPPIEPGLASSSHAIDRTRPAVPALLLRPGVVVGLPALLAFVPALSVLVGTSLPRVRWPRELRSGLAPDLALSAARPAIARALAARVIECRFLPSGSEGVR